MIRLILKVLSVSSGNDRVLFLQFQDDDKVDQFDKQAKNGYLFVIGEQEKEIEDGHHRIDHTRDQRVHDRLFQLFIVVQSAHDVTG